LTAFLELEAAIRGQRGASEKVSDHPFVARVTIINDLTAVGTFNAISFSH
jgi:hypothetical protein